MAASRREGPSTSRPTTLCLADFPSWRERLAGGDVEGPGGRDLEVGTMAVVVADWTQGKGGCSRESPNHSGWFLPAVYTTAVAGLRSKGWGGEERRGQVPGA